MSYTVRDHYGVPGESFESRRAALRAAARSDREVSANGCASQAPHSVQCGECGEDVRSEPCGCRPGPGRPRLEPGEPAARVTITLPASMLDLIDGLPGGRARSAIIADAIRGYTKD